MNYLEVTFTYDPQRVNGEVLLAELVDVPFESFVEEEGELQAFIQKSDWNKADLEALEFLKENPVSWNVKEIQQVNWNEEWEKNFDPIVVDEKCLVRATFHQVDKGYPYEILIDPKMSFGTGHHATTHLMISYMLDVDFAGKRVLDMGTGTGVLAILAEKLGCKTALAVDNNPWAFENSIENVRLNGCQHIDVVQGESETITGKVFDILLANINKNVIKSEFTNYANTISNGGLLLFSGILTEDTKEVIDLAYNYGLKKEEFRTRDKWSLLVFSKNSG